VSQPAGWHRAPLVVAFPYAWQRPARRTGRYAHARQFRLLKKVLRRQRTILRLVPRKRVRGQNGFGVRSKI
jgi:IS5 family transposase